MLPVEHSFLFLRHKEREIKYKLSYCCTSVGLNHYVLIICNTEYFMFIIELNLILVNYLINKTKVEDEHDIIDWHHAYFIIDVRENHINFIICFYH